MKKIILSLLISFMCLPARAERVLVEEDGRQIPTGRRAAESYMNRDVKPSSSISQPGERYLALHFGHYLDSDIHRWGSKNDKDEGLRFFGVTYRIGEWTNSSDVLLRVNWDVVRVDDILTRKISIMPMFSFPDARSKFPLYFGGGLGLGIFTKQIPSKSNLSFDYTIMAGFRMFDLFNNVGFMAEIGLNNHIFLTSRGQFSGTYFAMGAVFEF